MFPALPTDRFPSPPEGRPGPLALVAPVQGAMRLTALDAVAAAAGLAPGMTLADARAMVPTLLVEDADPDGDHALLIRLADAARRFTPIVALAPPHGLVLDVAGCAHLFGGERALMAEAIRRLGAGGRTVEAAIATGPRLARALARWRPGAVLQAGEERAALAPLPMAALGLDAARLASLARVGLKRVGDLLDKPRAPLAARFGADLLLALDRALGQAEEPIAPRLPAAPYLVERRFAEPVLTEAEAMRAIAGLAVRLAAMLADHGEGARRLEASLFRVDGAVRTLAVGLGRPAREAAGFAALFRERLKSLADPLDPGFGYDMIRLSVVEAAPLDPRQSDWDGAGADTLDRLVDRLGARLGPDRIERLAPEARHEPEQAERLLPAARAPAPSLAGFAEAPAVWPGPAPPDEPPVRPFRLFDPPEPVEMLAETAEGAPARFLWRRRLHEVAAAEGPERIAPAWWRRRDPAPPRDYYRVEDAEGLRLWLVASEAGGEPGGRRWRIHGIFA